MKPNKIPHDKEFAEALFSDIDPMDMVYDDLVDAIAECIRRALEKTGMTQRELAEKAGMHETRISEILSGDVNLTLMTLAKLQYALGCVIIDVPGDAVPYVFPYSIPSKTPSLSKVAESSAPYTSTKAPKK